MRRQPPRMWCLRSPSGKLQMPPRLTETHAWQALLRGEHAGGRYHRVKHQNAIGSDFGHEGEEAAMVAAKRNGWRVVQVELREVQQ